VAEIAFEGVAVDHDPVLVAIAGDAVAEVMAVGMVLGSELGDDHGHRFEDALELLRQSIDRVGDESFEFVWRRRVVHA